MSILKTGLQLACNGWFGDEPSSFEAALQATKETAA
jgi:hypothetical protein